MNKESIKILSKNENADITKVANAMPLKISSPQDLIELKIRINTLLWDELPVQVTIHEAEQIACRIFLMITEGEVTK